MGFLAAVVESYQVHNFLTEDHASEPARQFSMVRQQVQLDVETSARQSGAIGRKSR